MTPNTPSPHTIELPRCAYCPHYASDTIALAEGRVLYVCEEHYDQWATTQQGDQR